MGRTTAMRAAIIIAGLAVVVWLTPSSSWLDDAYISLHSAHVALEGVDHRYGSPALIGATSPPHVALYAVLLALGASDGIAMRIMMALGLAAFLGSLWLLASALRLNGWRRAVFLLIGVTAGPVIAVATNGLESGFAIALVAATLAWGLTGQSTALAVGTGLMPWLRPDLAVLAGAMWIWQLWRTPSAWRTLVITPVLVGLPFAIWLWVDTGSPVPATIAAKRVFFAEGAWPLTAKWRAFRQSLGGWLIGALPASAGLVFAWRSSIGRWSLTAASLTLAAYFVYGPSTIGFNGGRYILPILLPVAMFGTGLILAQITRPHYLALAALAAIAALPECVVINRRIQYNAVELEAVGAWVERHVPADATILVHDAGIVSRRGRHHLVDLVGLKTPASVDAHRRWTWPTAGRQRVQAMAAIARNANPDYLVTTTAWERAFGVANALRQAGYRLEMVRFPGGGDSAATMPLDAPENTYQVYRVLSVDGGRSTIPDAQPVERAAVGF